MAKEVNKRVNVFINGKEVENNIKSIRGAMAQLTNQLNKMTIGSKEYNDTSEKLKTLKKIYDDQFFSLQKNGKTKLFSHNCPIYRRIIFWGKLFRTVLFNIISFFSSSSIPKTQSPVSLTSEFF